MVMTCLAWSQSIGHLQGHLQWLKEDFAAIVEARERGELDGRVMVLRASP
jgi:hypothetical protein